jgi:hypothetical protein
VRSAAVEELRELLYRGLEMLHKLTLEEDMVEAKRKKVEGKLGALPNQIRHDGNLKRSVEHLGVKNSLYRFATYLLLSHISLLPH